MVATHAGWLHAVNELAKEVDELKKQEKQGGEDLSKKAEVKALKKISKPADATNEDIAAAVNAIIAALKA
jgi:seryl-tRNA synthetase